MARRLSCAEEVYAVSVGAAAACRRDRWRKWVWGRMCLVLSLDAVIEEVVDAGVAGSGLDGLKERW